MVGLRPGGSLALTLPSQAHTRRLRYYSYFNFLTDRGHFKSASFCWNLWPEASIRAR